MIQIEFFGRFECRLATGQDLFDEPRGELGWTFALPGEADLDRIIRFQDAVAPRSHADLIGVTVQSVIWDGNPTPTHPLVGTDVELLDGPVFEGRNGEIAGDAREPIVPFTIRFAADDAEIIGRDPIDLTVPAEIVRRAPRFRTNSPDVIAATGVQDRAAFRAERRARLLEDLAVATSADELAALEKRISQLEFTGDIRESSLHFECKYRFALRGLNSWTDPQNLLGPTPATGAPWQAEFWMGGWDADALCGWVKGHVAIG